MDGAVAARAFFDENKKIFIIIAQNKTSPNTTKMGRFFCPFSFLLTSSIASFLTNFTPLLFIYTLYNFFDVFYMIFMRFICG